MARWASGARERLEQAALELFLEQGFAETTVPQITARAGLTTRTFFRHFSDKREVLFSGEEHLPELVEGLIAGAPASMSPVAVISAGLPSFAATVFEGHLEVLRARRSIIHADEGLRERELRKTTALAAAIRQGFLNRGEDELTATLAAELAMTVFRVSIARWLTQDGGRTLAAHLTEVLAAFRAVAADVPPHGSGGPVPAVPPEQAT